MPKTIDKKELEKKIIKRLSRISRSKMQEVIDLLNRKKKPEVDYESVTAKLIIEGKKYPIILFRPKYSSNEYFKNGALMQH